MNRKLVIAAVMGLAFAATGCSELQGMVKNEGADGGTFMGGNVPVTSDPAGSATVGTGSTAYTGYDNRSDFAGGIGLDE